MSRALLPRIEVLETKALLSATPASTLALSLTATPETSNAGSQVVFNVTETNVGQQSVQVTYGPSSDGFVVAQKGKVVWTSNSGPQAEYLMTRTLQPGESISLAPVTWDEHADLADPSKVGPKLAGTFSVENELDPAHQPTSFVIPKVPPGRFGHPMTIKAPAHHAT